MATAIQFRWTWIHWLICASVCAVLVMWFFYIGGLERSVTDGTAYFAFPSRSPPLARAANLVPSTDDSQKERECDFFTCFDLSRCIHSSSKHVTVHLYDGDFSQTTGLAGAAAPSREHLEMISAVRSSAYSKDVEGSQKACLFIPPLDLLNLQKLTPSFAREHLQKLPNWNEGKNHLIVQMISSNHGSAWNNVFQKAIVAAADFTSSSYRYGLDVAIPVFNNPSQQLVTQSAPLDKRTWCLIILGAADLEFPFAIGSDAQTTLFLRRCSKKDNYTTYSRCGGDRRVYQYPDILQSSQFCLILDHSSTDLLDAMMMGCIPVFLQDGSVLPFSEVLDWTRASITIPTAGVHQVHGLLEGINAKRQEELRQQVHFLHRRYFSSMSAIIISILDIINERVLSLSAKGYEEILYGCGIFHCRLGIMSSSALSYSTTTPQRLTADHHGHVQLWWTADMLTLIKKHAKTLSPCKAMGSTLATLLDTEGHLPTSLSNVAHALAIATPKTHGFTAVVLACNRLATLFDVIWIISQVPSLRKVIVVWNNLVRSPPPLESWPKITQPLHVIRSKANKLSNRFYPYPEIETDAVLSIDDDINMLSADEIQFGFEVWCQYPTQLVGFPPRVHRWDETTQKWVYHSQWLSNISMVLTGAAFYHKYYNFLFTNGLPAAVKQMIDHNMNCEDIAMNFLISGHTGLPPIKVTPQEKFVCVDCPKGDSLWSKTAHYMARDECVHNFALEFGWNPLQTVHFRADPVLLYSAKSRTDTLSHT